MKYDQIGLLSTNCCRYNKSLIDGYTEHIWQASIENKLQCIGETRYPSVAVAPIPIPLGTPRKNEVVALSFFYKQNLLNSFLYLAQSKKCQDLICECGIDEQTAFHITAACKLVDKELQMECKRAITRCNGVDVVRTIFHY